MSATLLARRLALARRAGRLGGSLAALLSLADGFVRLKCAAGCDVGEAALGIVDKQQVDAFPLQPVVVVQPFCVNQCDVALTVLGDDLYAIGRI